MELDVWLSGTTGLAVGLAGTVLSKQRSSSGQSGSPPSDRGLRRRRRVRWVELARVSSQESFLLTNMAKSLEDRPIFLGCTSLVRRQRLIDALEIGGGSRPRALAAPWRDRRPRAKHVAPRDEG